MSQTSTTSTFLINGLWLDRLLGSIFLQEFQHLSFVPLWATIFSSILWHWHTVFVNVLLEWFDKLMLNIQRPFISDGCAGASSVMRMVFYPNMFSGGEVTAVIFLGFQETSKLVLLPWHDDITTVATQSVWFQEFQLLVLHGFIILEPLLFWKVTKAKELPQWQEPRVQIGIDWSDIWAWGMMGALL